MDYGLGFQGRNRSGYRNLQMNEVSLETVGLWIVLLWLCGFMLGCWWQHSRRRQDDACSQNKVRIIVVEIGEDEQIPKGKNDETE